MRWEGSMNGFALAVTCAALATGAGGGATSMTGKQAPGLFVSKWGVGPEVHLRNLRGRKVVLALYHTAC